MVDRKSNLGSKGSEGVGLIVDGIHKIGDLFMRLVEVLVQVECVHSQLPHDELDVARDVWEDVPHVFVTEGEFC